MNDDLTTNLTTATDELKVLNDKVAQVEGYPAEESLKLIRDHRNEINRRVETEKYLRATVTAAAERYNDIAARLLTAEAEIVKTKRDMETLRGLFTSVRQTMTGVAATILGHAEIFGKIVGDVAASGSSAAALSTLRVNASSTQETQGGKSTSKAYTSSPKVPKKKSTRDSRLDSSVPGHLVGSSVG